MMAAPGVMSVHRLDRVLLHTLMSRASIRSPGPRPEYTGAHGNTMYSLVYLGSSQMLKVTHSLNTLNCDTAKVAQLEGCGDLDSPNAEGILTFSPPGSWLYGY